MEEQIYLEAKKHYSLLGVDTDKAIETAKNIQVPTV